MIDAYGISRTRDKKGKIIKQEPLDWVNCIHTMVGGGWETMAVLVLEVYGKRRYNVQGEVLATMGGGIPFNSVSFSHCGMDGLSPTLRAGKNDASVLVNDNNMAKVYKIRKLTPKECMRLMGVSDGDFGKMKEAGISDSQLYKMAGNSIVVPVLEGIFTQMFRKDSDALF